MANDTIGFDYCGFATGQTVITRHKIYQNPLCDDPDVPRGTRGEVADCTDGYVFVDFRDPYGVVICEVEEIKWEYGV